MASQLRSNSDRDKTLSTSLPLASPAAKGSAAFQSEVKAESEFDSERFGEEQLSLPMKAVRAILGWVTPYEQMTFLRRKRDLKRWELFRDALMRRWSNLNVICGLIMGAVSSIVFADFPLSKASFTLGVISLLSSLIAIGFGVGLIYVLGDVRGSSLVMVDDRYPRLHLFALSIPEVWAFVSFGSFFVDMGVIVWEADDKGWVVKAGVTLSAVVFVVHIIAFGFLFREQDTTEFLIPDEPTFPSEEQEAERQQTPSHSWTRSENEASSSMSNNISTKGKAASLNGSSRPGTEGAQAGLPSRYVTSSQTLVDSPDSGQTSFRVPPVRSNTVPVTSVAYRGPDTEAEETPEAFIALPTASVAPLQYGRV